MNQKNSKSVNWILVGAVSALLAVLLGAFGAHALKAYLTDDLLKIYETGNRYHFYHSFAILVVGLIQILPFSKEKEIQKSGYRILQFSGWAFLIGLFLFSGSLYILAISGIRILGAITPLGGLSFMTGWILLVWFSFVSGSSNPKSIDSK